MDGGGTRSRSNVRGDETILQLTSTGNHPEITEVLPSGSGGRIRNSLPVDGRRSSNNVEDQSLPPSGERESSRQHSSPPKRRSIFSRIFRKRSTKKARLLRDKDGLEEKRGAMMIVSVLLATLTYQASLNPPGGFWQDDKTNGSGNNSTAPAPSPTTADDGHKAGTAINANIVGMNWFLIANTVGLFASLIVILILTSATTIKRQRMMWVLMIIMWVSIFSVAFSFFCGVTIILRDISYPAVKYLLLFGLGCMGLLAVLVILHALIGIKKMYDWFKDRASRGGNADPASQPPTKRTA